MHLDQDYIRQLVIEEIAGTISEQDAAQLRQIIAESAEAWVLYTRLHQELDTFEVRAAQEARFTGSFDKQQPLQTSLERLKSTGLIDYYFDQDSILHIQ